MWHKPDMDRGLSRANRKRLGQAAVFAGVAAAHLGVFALIASSQPSSPMALPPPPILVELFRPSPPPPPPPEPVPTEPSETPGGGAPAAPSRVHVVPDPPPTPPAFPPPREQAPEPAVVVGTAPTASPTPGFGQGGQGTGTGSGIGAGDGPGRGSVRTPPRNLRQPAPGQLRAYHPREALRRGVSGLVVVECRIREDTRLDDCRVLNETPPGQGFSQAGIRAATELYRFRPALIDGRPDYGLRAVMTLRFGRPDEGPAVG